MAEKFLLKHIFDSKMLSYISQQIKAAYPSFAENSFRDKVMTDLERLSFSERAQHISNTLHLFLPSSYLTAIDIIENALGAEIVDEEIEGYDCFYVMPLGIYVRDYGLDDFERSMLALKEMTKRFSSEWPIRRFIEKDEEKAFSYFILWAKDENCHVRRLVSEGARPRLPMGTHLKKYIQDPRPVLTLLQALKDEPTRLVQRSIANNLNDIAKDHPTLVTSFLQDWKRDKVKDIDWIISHACRSLIKNGDKNALRLMGYKTEVKIHNLCLDLLQGEVSLGGFLEFNINFELEEKSKLVIDYVLFFKKANGSLKPKVFKLCNKVFLNTEKIHLTKKHPLKEATTRKYYEGVQAIAIQINGKLYTPGKEFFLKLM